MPRCWTRIVWTMDVATNSVQIETTVIAGWTGRNRTAMEHHIVELEAIGVARPPRTPMFYRVSCQRLTTAREIEASGSNSSGEVEFVLFQHGEELLVGVGSDHTDREVERYDITVSKQMCDKPIAAIFWPHADVKDHWDELVLRSYADELKERVLYQEGSVAALLSPGVPVNACTGGADRLPSGTLMFGGTLPAIGGVRPTGHFEFALFDPVLKRRISHHYLIAAMPRSIQNFNEKRVAP